MTPFQTGLVCTSLFFSACACLYSWMSSVGHRLRRAQAGHLLLLAVNFLALSALMPALTLPGRIPSPRWAALACLLMLANVAALLGQLRWIRRHVSRISIRESCDRLPSALCFAQENGQPLLRNLKMDALSHQITGEALSNANLFWDALNADPVVTLEDGQSWSFERTTMEVDGQAVNQIIGTNVTEEVRLNRQLEDENRRLDGVNLRLRQYSLNAQAVAREKEAMRIKAQLHDELGYTVLRTHQYLSGGQDDPEEIRAAWKKCIRSLRSEGAAGTSASSYGELLAAARAIGVTIERQGEFPAEDTRAARLIEAATHESLTNLVRHAGGARLEVRSIREGNGWRVCFCNDGRIPDVAIREGGGLSSLRSQVESAGGTMTVEHRPRFQLTLILPREMEEDVQ